MSNTVSPPKRPRTDQVSGESGTPARGKKGLLKEVAIVVAPFTAAIPLHLLCDYYTWCHPDVKGKDHEAQIKALTTFFLDKTNEVLGGGKHWSPAEFAAELSKRRRDVTVDERKEDVAEMLKMNLLMALVEIKETAASVSWRMEDGSVPNQHAIVCGGGFVYQMELHLDLLGFSWTELALRYSQMKPQETFDHFASVIKAAHDKQAAVEKLAEGEELKIGQGMLVRKKCREEEYKYPTLPKLEILHGEGDVAQPEFRYEFKDEEILPSAALCSAMVLSPALSEASYRSCVVAPRGPCAFPDPPMMDLEKVGLPEGEDARIDHSNVYVPPLLPSSQGPANTEVGREARNQSAKHQAEGILKMGRTYRLKYQQRPVYPMYTLFAQPVTTRYVRRGVVVGQKIGQFYGTTTWYHPIM